MLTQLYFYSNDSIFKELEKYNNTLAVINYLKDNTYKVIFFDGKTIKMDYKCFNKYFFPFPQKDDEKLKNESDKFLIDPVIASEASLILSNFENESTEENIEINKNIFIYNEEPEGDVKKKKHKKDEKGGKDE